MNERNPMTTTFHEAKQILARMPADRMAAALLAIAASALDDDDSGDDTAAVVYEALAVLGIVVP